MGDLLPLGVDALPCGINAGEKVRAVAVAEGAAETEPGERGLAGVQTGKKRAAQNGPPHKKIPQRGAPPFARQFFPLWLFILCVGTGGKA